MKTYNIRFYRSCSDLSTFDLYTFHGIEDHATREAFAILRDDGFAGFSVRDESGAIILEAFGRW